MNFCFSIKLSKNYALDVNFLHIHRYLSDGLSIFEFNINSDWYVGDHNPQGTMRLVMLNVVLFELQIYNVNHVKDNKGEDHEKT